MMDILGAIAICTEPYDKNKTGSRISRRDKIILPEMWRQVLVQAAYQLLVMVILMYFGTFIFFEKSFNIITAEDRQDDGTPNDKLKMKTMFFHTFVLMQVFNQINCRNIDEKDINVFRSLSPLNHPIFWIVITFEVCVQQFMINAAETSFGSAILGAGPLTQSMQITAWCLGAFSLVVNVALKQIPIDPLFRKISKSIDLESNNKDEWINKYTDKAEA